MSSLVENMRKLRERKRLERESALSDAVAPKPAAQLAQQAAQAAPCPTCHNPIHWVDPFGVARCLACSPPRVAAMIRKKVVAITTPQGYEWEPLASASNPAPAPKPAYGPPPGVTFDAWWESLPIHMPSPTAAPAVIRCPRCRGTDFELDPKAPGVRWCLRCYPPSSRSGKAAPKPRAPRKRK